MFEDLNEVMKKKAKLFEEQQLLEDIDRETRRKLKQKEKMNEIARRIRNEMYNAPTQNYWQLCFAEEYRFLSDEQHKQIIDGLAKQGFKCEINSVGDTCCYRITRMPKENVVYSNVTSPTIFNQKQIHHSNHSNGIKDKISAMLHLRTNRRS